MFYSPIENYKQKKPVDCWSESSSLSFYALIFRSLLLSLFSLSHTSTHSPTLTHTEMAASMRIVFGLLTFVTVGMIIGALVQLAYIKKMEESYGYEFSFRRRLDSPQDRNLPLTRGNPLWANDKEAAFLRLGYVKPEIISWSPRIILFHNFLSPEECDYLRGIALPHLHKSTVVDTATGKGIESNVRTSSGMFLSPEQRKYPMVEAIEKRISVYSQVPIENGELIQVLRLTSAEAQV